MKRIIGAVSIMSDGDAEIIWNMILNQLSSSWDSIQETEPDEIDLQMLADIENDPDCLEMTNTAIEVIDAGAYTKPEIEGDSYGTTTKKTPYH